MKTTTAIIALLLFASCNRSTERCHTVDEFYNTNPAKALGYTQYKSLRVSNIGCNRFAVVVEDSTGQQCGYIMDYQP